MDGREFWHSVTAHPELEIADVVECEDRERDHVVVKHIPSKRYYALEVGSILQAEWSLLVDVLTWHREPRVLTHVTRIVGYFSFVHVWNRSKIAELRDRHKGEYALPQSVQERAA